MSERMVVITGANRGIGLGFVKAFLENGDRIVAVARQPEKAQELQHLRETYADHLFLVSFDVTDEPDIKKAVKTVQEKWDYVDILINNAGIFGGKPQDSVRNLNLEIVKETFDVNVLGPIRVTRYFLPLLEKGKEKKIIHITSLMGSIDDNKSGGDYAYRISKAALNMMNRSLAHELREQGICSVVMHPGWVKTEMGGTEAPTSVDESVRGIMTVISKLKFKDSGSFLNYQGSHLPW